MYVAKLELNHYYKFTETGHFVKLKDLMMIAPDGEVRGTWWLDHDGTVAEHTWGAHLESDIEVEEVSILEGMVNVGI
jgi:hypothetical protein